MKRIRIVLIFLILMVQFPKAQGLNRIKLSTTAGLQFDQLSAADGTTIQLNKRLPLFGMLINDSLIFSNQFEFDDQNLFHWETLLSGRIEVNDSYKKGWKARLTFINKTDTTMTIANVVPLGQTDDHIHIIASGPWSLARSKLFFPDRGPVGVILPDNAWELGYADWQLDQEHGLCMLTRREDVTEGKAGRWQTVLKAGGSVSYNFYADLYKGKWQEGLRLMFQERYLYDVHNFDNSMFERSDLDWVRRLYAMVLMYAWDHDFYDTHSGQYTYSDYLDRGQHYLGGWDAFALWPTWPTLGLDQRNQWDLYADLPGGLSRVREIAGDMQNRDTRFFVSYNPWDQSTRYVNPYEGLSDLIRNTNADGVVLDTYGHSTDSLQQAADAVKKGVCMYSEGMAVPKNMQGIISGRVHNAITMPPPLNLNKFIKPDFTIMRVAQLKDHYLHRDLALSFFNGYGTELNVMSPERPRHWPDMFTYFGKILMIQRENADNFISQLWTPLIGTTQDSIWVNAWPGDEKLIYTVFSLKPEGFNGPLFSVENAPKSHWVSLYHHEEIIPDTLNGTTMVRAKVEGFSRHWLNSKREGNIDCIARLPEELSVKLRGDVLDIKTARAGELRIWQGNPSYQKEPHVLPAGRHRVKLYAIFPPGQGKFVVQLLDEGRLIDERIVYVPYGRPLLISQIRKTKALMSAPEGMMRIPANPWVFEQAEPSGFLPVPDRSEPQKVVMNEFFMDRFPVTNKQFKKFLDASGYQPPDTVNYLKHWKNGKYPSGKADYPVVYVSIEDARAYAEWAGKRLPTEMEWQYAAQGIEGRKWPWGNAMDSSRCNAGIGKMTAVDAFPSGASPFGVMDMVGNVWQLTADEYDNGAHYFLIIRGGSYYHPSSSWWYVKGGPQPLNKTQMLLRVSPGFERNATVGFRCVVDAASP